MALLSVIVSLALSGAWALNFKPDLEKDKKVLVKSVRLNPEQGARAAAVNLQLVRGLYAEKKNPYAGEITSLIECKKSHAPEEFTVKCPKGEARAVAGGIGERDTFGFCGETQKLGVYFACYDADAGELIEVRAFQDFSGKPLKWPERMKSIKAWTAKLYP